MRAISPSEIVVFGKAYVDFEHLQDLDQREVWWVSRAKENMTYKVKKTLTKGIKGISSSFSVACRCGSPEALDAAKA